MITNPWGRLPSNWRRITSHIGHSPENRKGRTQKTKNDIDDCNDTDTTATSMTLPVICSNMTPRAKKTTPMLTELVTERQRISSVYKLRAQSGHQARNIFTTVMESWLALPPSTARYKSWHQTCFNQGCYTWPTIQNSQKTLASVRCWILWDMRCSGHIWIEMSTR